MVITALDGSKIKKLEFTFTSTPGTLTIDSKNVEDGSILVDGSSIRIDSTGSRQTQIKTIKITLE
jgi:riboflavin synthase alpha subunit